MQKTRACRLNFAHFYFEGCFRGYFSAVVRNVAGCVTNDNRERGRKSSKEAEWNT